MRLQLVARVAEAARVEGISIVLGAAARRDTGKNDAESTNTQPETSQCSAKVFGSGGVHSVELSDATSS